MYPETYSTHTEGYKLIVKDEPPECIEQKPLHIIDEITINPADEFVLCQVCESTENLFDVTLEVRYQEELRKMISIQSERVARKLKYLCQDCGYKIDTMIQLRKQYEGTFGKLFEMIQRKQLETEAIVLLEKLIIPIPPEEATPRAPSIDDQSNEEEVIKLGYLIGNEFDSNCNLKGHLRTHTGDKLYQCQESSCSFHQHSDFMTHMMKHSKAKPTRVHKCMECLKEFTRSYSLKTHMLLHSNIKPARRHKCTMCPKEFSRSDHLKSHMFIHTGEKPYKCAHCPFSTCHTKNLKLHILSIHKKERPHKCTECPKAFSSFKHLKRHKFIHTGEKPYKCKNCSYRTCYSRNLPLHILRVHKNERPFKCTECTKAFSRSTDLTRHMFSHTGVKPYKFTQCSACFISLNKLKAHMPIHSRKKRKETQHICHICDKSFANTWSLKIHLLIHTGEKAFKCSYCNMDFTQKISLTSHMQQHVPIECKKCRLCPANFTSRYNLRNHYKQIHLKNKKNLNCESDITKEINDLVLKKFEKDRNSSILMDRDQKAKK